MLRHLRQEDSFPWLFEGKASAWPGSLAERGWKYLRQALDLHDSAETDYKYTKAAIETILEQDRKRPLPPWIVCALDVSSLLPFRQQALMLRQDFDPEFLIRISLRYEKHDDAVEYSLSLIQKVRKPCFPDHS